MTHLIDIIAGARPNFMKIAPIIRAIQEQEGRGGPLRFRLVHTGQHYDANMSENFFSQLGIPEPDVNLGVGSGTQAEQTAKIMIGYERLLSDLPSDLCLVVGDVNSTMACAIVAKKMGIAVAHVEGGLRSGDQSMPEEINRMVTDSITDVFFTTSPSAGETLRNEGVEDSRIFFVGNTMIDTLLANIDGLRPPDFWTDLGLRAGHYLVLTLHRPANVDELSKTTTLLRAIGEGCRGLPVVFPMHPRTMKTIGSIPDLPKNIHLVSPQPYLEFNYLVRHAKGVITDSGGITEETTVLGVPCLTLRDNTERPETIDVGTNELIGTDPKGVGPALKRLIDGQWKSGRIPELWDGSAGIRIVAALEEWLGQKGA
jgi:UDP-N-acetylglucosamine 2-epimerase (non-hydrolysing)